jgi:hypothetical protein
MAKRFTDTDKWKRPWFNDLDLKAKFFWMYLLDNCDHRGVWIADFKLASFQVGFKVTALDLDNWFGAKIRPIADDKYFIRSFIDFQYGELSPTNNAHKPVIKLLSDLENSVTLAPSEDLRSPYGGAQDKDKEQDKDMDMDQEEEGSVPKLLKPEDLLKLWDKNRSSLPVVETFTEERRKKATAQIRKNPDPVHWTAVIHRWLKSDFCVGQWKPGFDDLLSQAKRTVTLEGKYDNRPSKTHGGLIRAPMRPVPTEPVKFDAIVGPLTEDGPRTFSPEKLALLKRTMGVG